MRGRTPRWAADGGNGSVVPMATNEEWLDKSIELSSALLGDRFFTAWRLSKDLFEELDTFTDQLLEQSDKNQDKGL